MDPVTKSTRVRGQLILADKAQGGSTEVENSAGIYFVPEFEKDDTSCSLADVCDILGRGSQSSEVRTCWDFKPSLITLKNTGERRN